MAFIDTTRADFTVESIVAALSKTAARIAVSTYYAFTSRPPSSRVQRDADLAVVIRDVYEANYSCYGVRKIWHALNRDHGHRFGHIARCTVERLMHRLGIDSIRRKRKKPATRSAEAADCPVDLVDRNFCAPVPNQLWLADITYVPTSAGWVYTAFVLDACTREIIGWQVTNHLRESLARDALAMALAARYRAGDDVSGLVHHSDRGVQYRALRYGETLAESKVVSSVGSRGDSYDNAMAEALNSVYKGELIDRQDWVGLVDVVAATSSWMGWYTMQRLHSGIGYRPPCEARPESSASESVSVLAA